MSKKMILIACGLLLAGAGLIGIGLLSGGTLKFKYVFGSKVITETDIQYEMQTDKVESFDCIDVKLNGLYWGSCRLELLEGEGYSVTYPKGNQYLTSSCKVENGVLQLETKDARKQLGPVAFQIDFLDYKVEQQVMQITVPKGIKLSRMQVASAQGDITVNGLNADEIAFNLEYGDLKIEDCESQAMLIANESGDVKIRKSDLTECGIEMQYGKLNMEDSRMQTTQLALESGDVVLDNVDLGQAKLALSYGSLTAKTLTVKALTVMLESGDANLSVAGEREACSMKLMTEAGDIKVAGERFNSGYQYNVQNAASDIEIESEYGSIRIEFEE